MYIDQNDGGIYQMILLPSNALDWIKVGVSAAGADALTAADIGAATAAQGALADATTVEQVTLTANLAYTLPADIPANTVHCVTFTQDGTGGHTVTYAGSALTIDPAPNAQTVTEWHPLAGGGWKITYPGASLQSVDAPELIRDTMAATLVAGANVTITPNDAGDTVTIAAAAGSGGGLGAALYLPGVSGNYVSCPDTPGTSITGDIDIRVRVAPAAWSSGGSTQQLCAKSAANDSNKSWQFGISGTGQPRLGYSTDGGFGVVSSGNVIAAPAGGWLWLRVTVDVDDGAGGATIAFYTSTDGTDWALNKANTVGAPISLYDSSSPLEVGSAWGGTSVAFVGLIDRFELYSGIGGTLAAKWDGRITATRQRDAAGNIWTLNGTANAWAGV